MATVAAVPRRPAAFRDRSPRWWRFLRRELAPTPDRTRRTLQYVLAVTIVQIVCMSLQVPEASTSCFMVFFLTKENRVTTLLTSVLLGASFGVGVVLSIFVYRFTFDYPEVRVPVMVVSTFLGMWFMRVCTLGGAIFAIGFVVALTQTLVDGVPAAEIMVRTVLWLGVALCFGALMAGLVGAVILPVSSKNSVVDGVSERLDLALAALSAARRREAPDRSKSRELLDHATQGSAQLLKYLGFAEKEDSRWKKRHNALTAAVTASEGVGAAAAALQLSAGRELSAADQQSARALSEEVASLKGAIRQQRRPAREPAGPGIPAESPRLRALQLGVAALRDSLSGAAPAAPGTPPKKKPPLFKPDTFTNPNYAHFALKVTLAAMTCFFLITAFDWAGTRTAFVTCCFIALETAGATLHKGALRITGCLGGALMGFLCLVYLIPHMTGLTELLLLSAIGAAVGGWIAAGSERIAYAGVQCGYAFFICIDQGFSPDVSFNPIRDRVIGILIGLAVSSVVYQFIWPERDTDKLRAAFARALRGVGKMLTLPPGQGEADGKKGFAKLFDGAINDLATAQQALDVAVFEEKSESTARTLASARPRQMVRHTQAMCLIAGALRARSDKEEWEQSDDETRGADERLRRAVADELGRTADFVEHRRPFEPTRLERMHGQEKPTSDRARLLERLTEECSLLTANCALVTTARGRQSAGEGQSPVTAPA